MPWSQVIRPIASNSNSATMKRLGVMVSYIGETYRWAKYEIDGVAAYDIDISSSWSPKESKMTLIGYGDPGLAYLLAHGYPYVPIYGNSDVDRFITQAAVWWYLSDLGINSLSNNFTSSSPDPYGLRTHIRRLVEAAKDMREIKVGDIYSIGREPLTACVFASNGEVSPHMVSLICPNKYAAKPISGTGAIDLAAEATMSGVVKSPSDLDNYDSTRLTVNTDELVILHDSDGRYHVLLKGKGLSNKQLKELIDRQVKLGNIPTGAEYSVSAAPSAPTREMKAIGSLSTMHHTGSSTGSMVGEAMKKGIETLSSSQSETPASQKGSVSQRVSDKPSKHYVFHEGDCFAS